jgi:leader peptidase (prepilin peptidase) / N-methyltransferase
LLLFIKKGSVIFTISFYIFSLFLSFTDFKKFLVPNDLIITMSLMLLVFGFFESKIYISSIVLSLLILSFFIVIMLINRQFIIGGGDIKYMMIVGLYLGLSSFALFLIVTGILQTITLLYIQNVNKRKIAPMVPVMFLSVIITEILIKYNFYTLKF